MTAWAKGSRLMVMDAASELRSLKRGLKALSLLNQNEAINVSQLAVLLDLPRTTAERILMTLVGEGYVHRIPHDKRYRLTPQVLTLASGFNDQSWVTYVANSYLFDVTQQIGWPLAICVPDGDRITVRLATDPTTSLWLMRRRVGYGLPIMNSSAGLVYLASLAPEALEAALERLRRSERPVNRDRANDTETLDAWLAAARAQGFAFNPKGEWREGSISVPIAVDGAVNTMLVMTYMSRVVTRAHVAEAFAPQLLSLAATIGRETEARMALGPQPAAAGAIPDEAEGDD